MPDSVKVGTAGSAVVFAGVTVIIALLGLLVVGIPFLSVMGVGAAERANKVRWGIAQNIITAWVITIPATALVAAGMYRLMIYGMIRYGLHIP